MKKLFNKMGFRKMDEMEQHIAFKAQRNAYAFLVVALFIWTAYESCQVFANQTRLNILPSLLLFAACAIQIISQLLLTHRAVKDEESYRPAPWLRVLMWVGAIVYVTGIVVVLGALFVAVGM